MKSQVSQKTKNDSIDFWIDIIFIFFAVSFTHFLLLLNDGIYWDGWNIFNALKENEWQLLFDHWKIWGYSISAYIVWFIGLFPNIVFTHKLFSFIAIFGMTIIVYSLSYTSGFMNRLESLFISIIFMAFPAYQMWAELTYTSMIILYFIFFVAWLIAIKKGEINNKLFYGKKFTGVGIRLLSLGLFLLSFGYTPILSIYGAFFIYLFYFEGKKTSCSDHSRKYVNYAVTLLKNFDYFLLPFIYWLIKKKYFVYNDIYWEYYGINLGFSYIFENFVTYISNAVIFQIKESINVCVAHPILMGIIFVVLLLFTEQRLRLSKKNLQIVVGKPDALISIPILVFSLIALICAMLPFIATGQLPAQHGWFSRFAIFISMPVAVFLVGISKVFVGIGFKHSSFSSYLNLSIMLLAITGFMLNTIQNYTILQKRWVKDRSIIYKLSKDKDAAAYSTYQINDDFKIIMRNDGSWEYYRPYEWNGIFKTAWGGETRLGGQGQTLKEFIKRTNNKSFLMYKDYDPNGRIAVVHIKPGPMASDPKVVYKYIYYRLTGSAEKINELLSQYVCVEVKSRM